MQNKNAISVELYKTALYGWLLSTVTRLQQQKTLDNTTFCRIGKKNNFMS